MKRFTATEKWEKTWYQELPPHLKCLWQYMCDKCDAAGVWEPNWKVASMFIGKTVSAADLVNFEGRIAKLKGGKILIGSFVEFQCGKLSTDCRAHIPVFRLIEKHSLSIGYREAMHSLLELEQEREEEEEEEKDKPKATPPADPPSPENKARGTLEEIRAFCVEIGLPASDGDSCFHKWEGKGWKNGGDPIKCWRSTIRSWRAAGYLPSQKNGGVKAPAATYPLTNSGPKGWQPPGAA